MLQESQLSLAGEQLELAGKHGLAPALPALPPSLVNQIGPRFQNSTL